MDFLWGKGARSIRKEDEGSELTNLTNSLFKKSNETE